MQAAGSSIANSIQAFDRHRPKNIVHENVLFRFVMEPNGLKCTPITSPVTFFFSFADFRILHVFYHQHFIHFLFEFIVINTLLGL